MIQISYKRKLELCPYFLKLFNYFKRYKIKNKKVEINLFSDLLQHSENFSFYDKNYDLKKFLKSLEFEKIRSDLSGIEVTIWQLINSQIDNIRIRDHWKEIFKKMKTKYLPTIEPISG